MIRSRNKKLIIFVLLVLLLGGVLLFAKPKKSNQETVVKKRIGGSQTDTTNQIDRNPNLILPPKILLEVPFTSQSPFAQWSDPEQNSACEEASMVMAQHWLNGEPLTQAQADSEIKALIAYENQNYGNSYDTSAADTKKIFEKYFSHDIAISYDITLDDILAELGAGHLVIVPANGIALNNPHFKQPGPETHMLVIKGFDNDKTEFITNDPGTRVGESYVYPYDILLSAVRDYPTGNHLPINEARKAMLVVSK